MTKKPPSLPRDSAGLGLRRVHFDDLLAGVPAAISFMEVAPENWMEVGGAGGRKFRQLAERVPLVCHGLALNLGGHAPLDVAFLGKLRGFFADIDARFYSEHLSYCGDHAHLYDLMPLPFTGETVRHVAARIRQAQDVLGMRMAVENVSYYAQPGTELTEIEFLNAVLSEADCLLHLDINNIYVNSINHGYDAAAFVRAVPGERIAYGHVAGHHYESEHLRIDTHGADVIEPVWQLLNLAYAEHGVFPTLLERDFDIPPLADAVKEVEIIEASQAHHLAHHARARARRLAHV